MHVVKRDGLRLVTLTEEEFNTVLTGFNSLLQKCKYEKNNLHIERVGDANVVIIEVLTILCEDMVNEHAKGSP